MKSRTTIKWFSRVQKQYRRDYKRYGKDFFSPGLDIDFMIESIQKQKKIIRNRRRTGQIYRQAKRKERERMLNKINLK